LLGRLLAGAPRRADANNLVDSQHLVAADPHGDSAGGRDASRSRWAWCWPLTRQQPPVERSW